MSWEMILGHCYLLVRMCAIKKEKLILKMLLTLTCYMNGVVVFFMYMITIFHLKLPPSGGLPYYLEITFLVFLCLWPIYVVNHTEKFMSIGSHDYSKDKVPKETQKKYILLAAYIWTALITIYSLAIIRASFRGFDYSSPLFS